MYGWEEEEEEEEEEGGGKRAGTQIDGRTVNIKLIVPFRNFADAPKNLYQFIVLPLPFKKSKRR
jgi:hypothetical protein